MFVDSHAHCALDMLEPVEKLLEQMDANGVDKALLLPHRSATDHTYLIDCMRRFPTRFSVSCRVNADSPSALDDLERWRDQGAQDVRLKDDDRSPGPDPLAIWRKTQTLGMTAHVGGGPTRNYAQPDFFRLVQELPDLTFVFEHLIGMGLKPTATRPKSTGEDLLAALELARFPNTYVKIHGMGEICDPPYPYRPVPPYLRMTYDAFGPQRMMWGSDWPFVLQNEPYGDALHRTIEHLSFCTSDDLAWISGKTALALWKF